MQNAIEISTKLASTKKTSLDLQKDLDCLRRINPGSNSEYLIFKTVGEEINTELTPSELDKVFEIIHTYCFPMNQNPLYKEKINALTTSEREEMLNFEKQFILKKIKAINPNLEIFPIPKSMYQLFFILTKLGIVLNKAQQNVFHAINDSEKHAEELKATLDQAFASGGLELFHKTLALKTRFDLTFTPNNCYPDMFYPDCHDFTFFHVIKNIWHLINIALLNEFKENIVPKKELFIGICQAWLDIAIKQLRDPILGKNILKMNEGSGQLDILISPQALQNQKLLLGLIAKEYELSLQFPNDYFIYRGSDLELDLKGYDDCFKANTSCALSFSDGILAGYINDLHTGCAFYYIMERTIDTDNTTSIPVSTRPAYLLRVCKKDERALELVFIPPIGNIARLCGMNELHHARSKMSREILPAGVMGTNACINLGFLHNDLSYQVHIQRMIAFMKTNMIQIKENFRGLKAPSSTGPTEKLTMEERITKVREETEQLMLDIHDVNAETKYTLDLFHCSNIPHVISNNFLTKERDIETEQLLKEADEVLFRVKNGL